MALATSEKNSRIAPHKSREKTAELGTGTVWRVLKNAERCGNPVPVHVLKHRQKAGYQPICPLERPETTPEATEPSFSSSPNQRQPSSHHAPDAPLHRWSHVPLQPRCGRVCPAVPRCWRLTTESVTCTTCPVACQGKSEERDRRSMVADLQPFARSVFSCHSHNWHGVCTLTRCQCGR